MHQRPNQLLSELITYIRLVPPTYRVPLALVALLAVGVIVAIIMVSSTAEPPPQIQTATALAVPAEPVKVAPENPVTELFDPTQEQNAEQKRQTTALTQIDNILLTCYLLTKCNKLKAEEYSDTYQLLVYYAKTQKLAPTDADADALVRERAKATTGSYQLVYSHTQCKDIDKNVLYDNLDKWRKITRLAPIRDQMEENAPHP